MKNVVFLIILLVYIIFSNKNYIESFNVADIMDKFQKTDMYKNSWEENDKGRLKDEIEKFLDKATVSGGGNKDNYSLAKKLIEAELNKGYCKNKNICDDSKHGDCNCNIEIYKIIVKTALKNRVYKKCFEHEMCQQGGVNLCKKLSLTEQNQINKFCEQSTDEYFEKNSDHIRNMISDENINDWFNQKFETLITNNTDLIKNKRIIEYCKKWKDRSPFGEIFPKNHAPEIDKLGSAWYGLKKMPTAKRCAKTGEYVTGESDDKSQIGKRSDIWGKQKKLKKQKLKALEPLWTSVDNLNVDTNFDVSTSTDYLEGGKCFYNDGEKDITVEESKCLSEYDCKKYSLDAKCIK